MKRSRKNGTGRSDIKQTHTYMNCAVYEYMYVSMCVHVGRKKGEGMGRKEGTLSGKVKRTMKDGRKEGRKKGTRG
jgi:hypothetical protein